MRIVADTNLLIASVFWNGAPYDIVQLALDNRFEIITSTPILNEVRNVLKDPKEGFELSEQEIDDIVNCILGYAMVVEPVAEVSVVRDAKDNHIISCALAAKAEYIVTRDKDILVLKNFVGIKMIKPEDFLKLLR